MLKLGYEEIAKRIEKEAGLTREEIEEKIQEKIKQLSDLISKDGAAYILANQMGIKLQVSDPNKIFKINEIPSNVGSVNLAGKVLSISSIVNFRKENRQGKVQNFLIADETGSVRIVVWDEKIIDSLDKGFLKEGDIVKVVNAYTRMNNGNIEIHLGNKSSLFLNPEDIVISEIKYSKIGIKRKEIIELKEQESAQIYGTVVQLFEPRHYNVCSNCKRKVFLDGGSYRCIEHGIITPKEVPVVNFFLDDGSSNIRVVAFNEQAISLLGDNKISFEELRMEILGKQILINGRTNKNQMYDRIEFVAEELKEANPTDLFMER